LFYGKYTIKLSKGYFFVFSTNNPTSPPTTQPSSTLPSTPTKNPVSPTSKPAEPTPTQNQNTNRPSQTPAPIGTPGFPALYIFIAVVTISATIIAILFAKRKSNSANERL
jgi:hypothetical protein